MADMSTMTTTGAAAQPPLPTVVDFFVLGSQRSGTTWIDAALREHPQVYLPVQKQTYFFDQNLEKGLDWYLAQFRDAPVDCPCVGEVATSYSMPHAFPPLADAFPHARLVLVVRNPVDRAYSHYLTRRAANGWTSFEQAMDEEPGMIQRGEYIDQVELILNRFPVEQFLLQFFDDLERNDREFLRRLLTFLEVDPDVQVSALGQQINSAMHPGVRRALHRMGLKSALAAVSRSPIGDAIRRRKRRSVSAGYQPMSAATRRRLELHFRPFNNRLALFAGRDLSHWG